LKIEAPNSFIAGCHKRPLFVRSKGIYHQAINNIAAPPAVPYAH
jgi:hypothetical protein